MRRYVVQGPKTGPILRLTTTGTGRRGDLGNAAETEAKESFDIFGSGPGDVYGTVRVVVPFDWQGADLETALGGDYQ